MPIFPHIGIFDKGYDMSPWLGEFTNKKQLFKYYFDACVNKSLKK
jgi:hypothetical protein